MAGRRVLLFDFFGTLVDYSTSRVEQGYTRSHELVVGLGTELSYTTFLDRWSEVSSRFDERSDIDDREFSMYELGGAFLAEVLGRRPIDAEVAALVNTYLAEWNTGVRPIAGVPELLEQVAREYRLAVVTNTHHTCLVPDHLTAMGIAHHFDAVITSVDIGYRKPHPDIYHRALDTMASDATDTTFIGDTRSPDYDGPRAMGMHALLIDPTRAHDIPEEDRLDSVLDLGGALARQTWPRR